MVSIERSPKMILAAYFMAKFGEASGRGNHKPPAEMGVASWAEAYERLFPQLGDGRSFETFRGSINQDRRHYLDCLAGRKTDTEARREILGDWVHRGRAELWAEVRRFMS